MRVVSVMTVMGRRQRGGKRRVRMIETSCASWFDVLVCVLSSLKTAKGIRDAVFLLRKDLAKYHKRVQKVSA